MARLDSLSEDVTNNGCAWEHCEMCVKSLKFSGMHERKSFSFSEIET